MAKIATKSNRWGPFASLVRVNGQPGRIMRTADGALWDVLTIDVVDGKVQTIRIIRNPDKLQHL
jgi:RNA polymerase sigma-70 factor (ECF subfamily)